MVSIKKYYLIFTFDFDKELITVGQKFCYNAFVNSQLILKHVFYKSYGDMLFFVVYQSTLFTASEPGLLPFGKA